MGTYIRPLKKPVTVKGRFSLGIMRALSRSGKRRGGNYGKKRAKKMRVKQAALRKSLYTA